MDSNSILTQGDHRYNLISPLKKLFTCRTITFSKRVSKRKQNTKKTGKTPKKNLKIIEIVVRIISNIQNGQIVQGYLVRI